jgi:hypothetical protein
MNSTKIEKKINGQVGYSSVNRINIFERRLKIFVYLRRSESEYYGSL